MDVTFVVNVEVDGFAMIETVLVGIGIVVALRTIGDVLRGSCMVCIDRDDICSGLINRTVCVF